MCENVLIFSHYNILISSQYLLLYVVLKYSSAMKKVEMLTYNEFCAFTI